MEDIYSHYGEDMHMSLDEFKREVTRWRHRWLLSEEGSPQSLVETLDYANAELYPGNYLAIKTLLAYPVTTCVADRAQLQWHEKAQNATSEHNVRREIVLISGPTCA